MAFTQWIQNQIPATGPVALYLWRTMLEAAGWTTVGSGDGLAAYSATDGTAVTSGAAGVNGFNNSQAWFRMRDPANLREFVIQRGSGGSRTFWIRYSKSARFTGGAPDTNDMPTATDQQDVWGTSNAGTTLTPVDGSYRFNGGADSASPYSFWLGSWPTGGGVANFGLMLEGLTEANAADTDPVVWYVGGASAYLFTEIGYINGGAPTVVGVQCWVPSGVWDGIAGTGSRAASGNAIPGGLPVNPWDGKDNAFPIAFPRRAASSPVVGYGFKGVAANALWEGTTRSNGDTKNTLVRIVYGNVTLPWDGVTVPTL